MNRVNPRKFGDFTKQIKLWGGQEKQFLLPILTAWYKNKHAFLIMLWFRVFSFFNNDPIVAFLYIPVSYH